MSKAKPPATSAPRSDLNPAAAVWALVEGVQRGESEAFGLIYDLYVDKVFRFIYFRVGNDQPTAEDLTSETFFRALKQIGSLTWQEKDISAWLMTIARNLVVDHFKSVRVRRVTSTDDMAAYVTVELADSPEDAMVQHITNLELLVALKSLTQNQQDCIVLRFLCGYSVEETAEIMGIKENAVRSLQKRALPAMRRNLPPDFGDAA